MPSITYWNRVEPRPRANDLAEPLAARIRDPVWMLTRQWQVGEFQGEDAASPAYVRFTAELVPLVAWSAGDVTRPLDPGMPLERTLEAEPLAADDLSTAVELGRTFERLLDEATAGDLLHLYRDVYRIPSRSGEDPQTTRLSALWQDRVVDGAALYRAALSARPSLPPPAIDPSREGAARAAIEGLLAWVEEVFGGLGEGDPAGWVPDRLEYAASVTSAPAPQPSELSAHPGRDGRLDWYSFDASAAVVSDLPAGETRTEQRSVIPAAVLFRGMPNPRWWDFEDRRVDFGAVTPDRRDLARLMLMDFLLVHGNDWFLVPFDQPLGTLCRIPALAVHDVFGGETAITRSDSGGADGPRFTMFSTATDDGGLADGFLVPPSAASALQPGPAVEDVRFLRDEVANMVWAVEHSVQGPLGEPVAGQERPGGVPSDPPPVASDAPLRYLIQTDVPSHWIPFVPVAIDPANREIALELAALLSPDAAPGDPNRLPKPLGRVLHPNGVGDAAYRIREEEVSREGTRVARVVQLARWLDGSTHLWVARHRSVGTGEGWSGLRYDVAVPSRRG
jgi:hypothetical protein